MSSLRPRSRKWNAQASAALALVAVLAFAALPHTRAQQVTPSSGWRDVTLSEYVQHLQALEGVVTNCSARLSLKTPPPAAENACDPARVGPDDRLHSPGAAASEPREIRYDWLRS